MTKAEAGGVTTCTQYDITGMPGRIFGDVPVRTITPAMNHAVPDVSQVIDLATDFDWNSFLGLTRKTGANGEAVQFTYDNYARVDKTTSPHGAETVYTYQNSPPMKQAVTNGRWSKSWFDGFGRVIKVEAGDGGGTKSIVETEYVSCACSALGKVKRVSNPYKSGELIYWTDYAYDALGRTISVTLPGNTGVTTYVYEGNTVKVTDPAGKWKKRAADVFGNVVEVVEPRPGGGEYTTTYTYTMRDQLKTVTMPRDGYTQTRTFDYDLATGRLTKETLPESGETNYYWNTDGTLDIKLYAAGQRRLEDSYDGWLMLFNREETEDAETTKHTQLSTARLRFLFLAAKIWRHGGRTGVSYSDHYEAKGVFQRLTDRLRRIAPRGQGYAPVMQPALS